MITQDKIAEIRQRASIVEVVSDYVPLKKAGRNHMGLCPFHAEKSPSFTVSEEKGIYHCFGCHAGGSVFHFLMQYDHLSFPESVERVAKRYGITIDAGARAGNAAQQGEREKLYRVNERAAANYQKMLFGHPEGRCALEYLKGRGVDEATARKYLLGYAPQTGSGLLSLAKQENFSPNDAMRLGLVGQREGQRYYEKFFARIMFPIVNPAGKVVGFGGRVLNQGMPKYLNSSETPLFHKGATLYGLYQAKEAIRQRDRVVVVEGYLDAIALAQYGVADCVATLGTALTVDHVRTLSRYTKNIIALFDGDDAGSKAAARSFEIFIEAGLFGRAAFLPKGEDPDTFVRAHGKAAIETVLERAVPLADYFFTWLDERHGKTLEGKSQIASEISRLLAKVTNPFEVDLLVRRAVDRLEIREEVLRRPATPPPARQASTVAPTRPAEPVNRDDVAERSLVSLMLRSPALLARLVQDPETRQWFGAKWRPLVDGIIAECQERKNLDLAELMHRSPPEQAREMAALVLDADRLSDAECDRMAHDCLLYLRRKYLKSLERNLRVAIRTAEEQRDENAKRERMLEWQDLLKKERQLERPRLESKTVLR
jgi:DNA primase